MSKDLLTAWISAAAVVGCAAAARPAPAMAAPPVSPEPLALPVPAELPELPVYLAGGPVHDTHISTHPDDARWDRARASLFPKRLSSLAQCPRPFSEPSSWVQVDELQARNFRAGRFVAVVEQRIDGRFSGPDVAEYLFVIRIDNCQTNMFGHFVFATFPATAFDESLGAKTVRPSLQWETHPLPSERGTFVAVLQDDAAQPPRLLEALPSGDFELVELNRAFAPGAIFGVSPHGVTLDGAPMREPWKVVDSFPRARPGESAAFYRSRPCPSPSGCLRVGHRNVR